MITEEQRRKYYDARNAKRKTDEFRAKRRATRDLEKNREACRAYYTKNREKILAKHKEDSKKPEVKERMRQYRQRDYVLADVIRRGKEKIANIELRYARECLNRDGKLSGKYVPKELIEAKQLQLLIRREVNEKRK